ncbi:tetraacyldisaccharide 4'-kinase [Labilibacter marinus]|uniref:tetraacyldisaccharide 4'-kinase n=1 Tax=Labilibacter marinus TaxID=1477105 RepID=UPI00082EA707|nr:tetraacyldisaccharide 4'-kinase [Labilibacter marinus]
MKVVKYIRILLLPISLLYGVVVRMRNLLFNIGKIESKAYSLPIISVGNITVGGTGKTPLTEFIINSLKDKYQLALLSRGYKRATKGVLIADEKSQASDIGDEPKQIKDKFEGLTVAVAEKRVEGIKALLSLNNSPDVIVMDDAYQHRYVKPGLSILVIDYNRPLWKDIILPAGELREPMNGKKRADIILFSKCPNDLSKADQDHYIRKIKPSKKQPVYFSKVGYQSVLNVFTGCQLDKEKLQESTVIVVTGIANSAPFITHLKTLSNRVSSINFPDHHHFSEKDIEAIMDKFKKIEGENKYILTTEKDAVRFKQIIKEESGLRSKLFYVPIEIEILNEKQQEFKEKLISYVEQNKRNC